MSSESETQILFKLNKIIELLENIKANQPMPVYRGIEIQVPKEEDIAAIDPDYSVCNCGNYQLTGGIWWCPVHGTVGVL